MCMLQGSRIGMAPWQMLAQCRVATRPKSKSRRRRPGSSKVLQTGSCGVHIMFDPSTLDLIWGFPSMGVPPNGWFILGNPTRMDDDWRTPISGNLHITVRGFGTQQYHECLFHLKMLSNAASFQAQTCVSPCSLQMYPKCHVPRHSSFTCRERKWWW